MSKKEKLKVDAERGDFVSAVQNSHIGRGSIMDGIANGNGQNMAVYASKVTPIHDGSVQLAKSDPQDSAIFAKTGGPFDTLFNGIFDKISLMYDVLTIKRFIQIRAIFLHQTQFNPLNH